MGEGRGRESEREGERERATTGYEPLRKAQTVVAGEGGGCVPFGRGGGGACNILAISVGRGRAVSFPNTGIFILRRSLEVLPEPQTGILNPAPSNRILNHEP